MATLVQRAKGAVQKTGASETVARAKGAVQVLQQAAGGATPNAYRPLLGLNVGA